MPVGAAPNFTVYNSFHSASSVIPGASLGAELQGEILGVCPDDCDVGVLRVVARAMNTGENEVAAGVVVALYGRSSEGDSLVGTQTIAEPIPSGRTSVGLSFDVSTEDLVGVDALWLSVDDDGSGLGRVPECVEDDNGYLYDGELCP